MTEPRNDGITEGQGESSIAPLFQSGAIIKSGLGQRGGTYVLKRKGVQAKHMNPPKSATDVFKVISEQLNMFTGDS